MDGSDLIIDEKIGHVIFSFFQNSGHDHLSDPICHDDILEVFPNVLNDMVNDDMVK